MKFLVLLFLLSACVTKSDLKTYMQFKDDVFRHCIKQCNGTVLDLKVKDNKLECVCREKETKK